MFCNILLLLLLGEAHIDRSIHKNLVIKIRNGVKYETNAQKPNRMKIHVKLFSRFLVELRYATAFKMPNILVRRKIKNDVMRQLFMTFLLGKNRFIIKPVLLFHFQACRSRLHVFSIV